MHDVDVQSHDAHDDGTSRNDVSLNGLQSDDSRVLCGVLDKEIAGMDVPAFPATACCASAT